MTTGAALAGAAVVPQVLAAKSAVTQYSDNKTSDRSALTHKFRLEKDGKEAVNNKGGSIRLVNKSMFPILNGLTMYSVHLHKGGLREPHWHPNADECNYLISGKVLIGVLNPDGSRETVELNPGDIGYIPMGYFHYINNIADGESQILVSFNNASPEDIGVSDALGFVPNDLLGTTFGVPATVFEPIPKPKNHILVAPQG